MASVSRVEIDIKPTIALHLSEAEARALDGIFGYNVDAFLKVFYEKMGRAYVEQHEAGVRSLHATIRGVVSGPLAKIDVARRGMHDALRTAAQR